MDAIFPLAQKYGGLIVELTLDDDGIPATVEGRMSVAKKILTEAKKYGIDKKDIIFDPLAMTISADPDSANVTLECIRKIRTELGCHTSLGVSNVSFGLPSRSMVNSTFFSIAMHNGLSAAIMNPNSVEMLGSYHAFRAIAGLDENFAEYIEFTQNNVPAAPAAQTASKASAPSKTNDYGSPLKNAIIKGLKDKSADITCEMLKTTDAMTIVTDEVIPALDIVGEGYEKGKMFLPQLLMSAESAQAAFEKIKSAMQSILGGAEE